MYNVDYLLVVSYKSVNASWSIHKSKKERRGMHPFHPLWESSPLEI